MNMSMGGIGRTMAGLIGGAALLLAGTGLASAHVTIKADETAAGSFALLTVAFSHGCDGSPTTQIAISVPDEIETIKPGMNYGWTVETKTDDAATPDAATPAAGEEGAAPGRISEIVYTAKEPVPDGFYDQFLLQVKLPDNADGKTIAFPVVQTCEKGEVAWIQIPADGQSAEDLDNPAPSITVTAPKDDAGH